nr:hypothetical protein [Tanacetum cinerariifolium]
MHEKQLKHLNQKEGKKIHGAVCVDAIPRFSADILEGVHTNSTSQIRRPSDEIDTSKRVCRPATSARSIHVRRPARRPPIVARVDTEGSISGHE